MCPQLSKGGMAGIPEYVFIIPYRFRIINPLDGYRDWIILRQSGNLGFGRNLMSKVACGEQLRLYVKKVYDSYVF